jgi:tetratricopeptide (TPR) repeat protein
MRLDDLIRRIFYGRRKEEKEAATARKLLEDPVLREALPERLQGNTILRLAIEVYEGVSDLEEIVQEIETAEKATDEEFNQIDELIVAIEALRDRRHPLAVTLAEICYRLSKRVIGDEYRMALCMQALGETQLMLGRNQLALPPLKEAIEVFLDEEEWPRIVSCYGNMGVAWRRLGDIDAAAEYFERALSAAVQR